MFIFAHWISILIFALPTEFALILVCSLNPCTFFLCRPRPYTEFCFAHWSRALIYFARWICALIFFFAHWICALIYFAHWIHAHTVFFCAYWSHTLIFYLHIESVPIIYFLLNLLLYLFEFLFLYFNQLQKDVSQYLNETGGHDFWTKQRCQKSQFTASFSWFAND